MNNLFEYYIMLKFGNFRKLTDRLVHTENHMNQLARTLEHLNGRLLRILDDAKSENADSEDHNRTYTTEADSSYVINRVGHRHR